MNRVLEYIIRAKDATGSAIRTAAARGKDFAVRVGTQLANIKAGFDMLSGVVRQFAGIFGSAIKEAFKFEKAQSDFTGLLNSVDKAKEHIAELRQFASSTPLTFGDLSRASKLLLSFGASVEEVMPYMKMLGDIAMGDVQKFQGLSLVFAQVKSAGKLMGQDLLQMINQGFNPLTVIAQQTGKSMGELKDMMAEGAISFDMVAEAMRVATSEGGLFNNAMENASKTGEGLMSTLQDKWTDVVRTFGEAFADTAKGGLQELIDKLTQLVEDGTVEVWAGKVASAMTEAKEMIMGVVSALHQVGDAVPKDTFDKSRGGGGGVAQFIGNAWAQLGAIGAGIRGAFVPGESFSENYAAYGALHGYGEFADACARELSKMKNESGEWSGDVDIRDAQKEYEDEVRQRALDQKAEKAENAAKKSEAGKKEQTKSLAEMMVDAEAKAREKEQANREKELAQRKKELEKLAKEEERERLEIEREVARERDRLQRQTINEYEQQLRDAQSEQSVAERWLSEAQAKSREAWGWYRDKDSLQKQLDEEKANAEAEKQFEKDFAKLKRRGIDWRTADNLSLEDEAVRRVGLAREEEKAAQQYAQQTAEATQAAAEALDEIRAAIVESAGGEE